MFYTIHLPRKGYPNYIGLVVSPKFLISYGSLDIHGAHLTNPHR